MTVNKSQLVIYGLTKKRSRHTSSESKSIDGDSFGYSFEGTSSCPGSRSKIITLRHTLRMYRNDTRRPTVSVCPLPAADRTTNRWFNTSYKQPVFMCILVFVTRPLSFPLFLFSISMSIYRFSLLFLLLFSTPLFLFLSTHERARVQ